MKNKKKNIEPFFEDKPELRFIVEVLSEQSVVVNEVEQSVDDFNQDEFIRLIKHHRLDSIFYRALQEQNIQFPIELKAKLEKINKRNKIRMMKLTAELIRIHQLFTENDIDYISLKGPALSQQIYGDYTIRSSRDLDILVKTKDFIKASNLLKSIDYKNNKKFNIINRFNYKEYKFINEKRNVLVELHHRVFNNKYLLPMDVTIFNNREFIQINDMTIPVLPIRSNFEYLALHALAHNWKRMHWPLDVILLKQKTEDLYINSELTLLRKTIDYNLQDYVINGSEHQLILFGQMTHLLRFRGSVKYKLQELLQRLFIPYRYFDNL